MVLEGVDPWATWFNDKPVHRGGRILSARLFGPDFMQDSASLNSLLTENALTNLHDYFPCSMIHALNIRRSIHR